MLQRIGNQLWITVVELNKGPCVGLVTSEIPAAFDYGNPWYADTTLRFLILTSPSIVSFIPVPIHADLAVNLANAVGP